MRTRLAAMVLVFEAITCGLAIPVAAQVSDADAAARALAALAIVAVLAAGVLRRPGGFAIGLLLQAGLLSTCWLVPAFAFVAVPFVTLWWFCLRIGGRIDREREQLHPPTEPA